MKMKGIELFLFGGGGGVLKSCDRRLCWLVLSAVASAGSSSSSVGVVLSDRIFSAFVLPLL